MVTSEVEDLLVTFVHRTVKNEPIIDNFHCSQLDGQVGFLIDNKRNNDNQTLNSFIFETKSKSTHRIQMNDMSQKLNTYQTSSNRNNNNFKHNERLKQKNQRTSFYSRFKAHKKTIPSYDRRNSTLSTSQTINNDIHLGKFFFEERTVGR